MSTNISFFDILRSLDPFPIKVFKLLDYGIGGLCALLTPALAAKEPPLAIKKILVIRPGGIGDAVFLLPILHVLKEQGIVVDILCEQRNAQVFRSQPGLFNKIYLYDRELLAVLNNSYDVVVDTEQWHYLSALVAYVSKSSYKIGFATRARRAKLFHKRVEYGLNDYELNNFHKLFRDILKLDIKGLEHSFVVDSEAMSWAKSKVPANAITLFLGASITLRRLTKEELETIVRHFIAQDHSIVLVGGKDVEESARCLIAKINSPKVFNFVGEVSLLQTAALIKKSVLFIGPDSGVMHLACAVGTPVVGIFGPGNLQKWAPKDKKHKVVTENVSCSPCTKFGYTIPTCHGSYHCLRTIKLNEVCVTADKSTV